MHSKRCENCEHYEFDWTYINCAAEQPRCNMWAVDGYGVLVFARGASSSLEDFRPPYHFCCPQYSRLVETETPGPKQLHLPVEREDR